MSGNRGPGRLDSWLSFYPVPPSGRARRAARLTTATTKVDEWEIAGRYPYFYTYFYTFLLFAHRFCGRPRFFRCGLFILRRCRPRPAPSPAIGAGLCPSVRPSGTTGRAADGFSIEIPRRISTGREGLLTEDQPDGHAKQAESNQHHRHQNSYAPFHSAVTIRVRLGLSTPPPRKKVIYSKARVV